MIEANAQRAVPDNHLAFPILFATAANFGSGFYLKLHIGPVEVAGADAANAKLGTGHCIESCGQSLQTHLRNVIHEVVREKNAKAVVYIYSYRVVFHKLFEHDLAISGDANWSCKHPYYAAVRPNCDINST
jgi:hypothetical protein